MIRCSVILPAAGAGQRFAAGGAASASKIEFELDGRAVFLRAIDLFHGRPEVAQIVLAVAPGRIDEFRFRWESQLAFMDVKIVPGGRVERWETVQNALQQVDADVTHIAVHDAARPCTPEKLIDRVFLAAERYDAVIPGLPVSSTLKRVGAPAKPGVEDPLDAILGGVSDEPAAGGDTPREVIETVPRTGLVAVQTPQVFAADLLREAYANLPADPTGVTDDAALIEALGRPTVVVPGDPANLKLTHPGDAELMAALLAHRRTVDAKANAVRELFGDDDDD